MRDGLRNRKTWRNLPLIINGVSTQWKMLIDPIVEKLNIDGFAQLTREELANLNKPFSEVEVE